MQLVAYLRVSTGKQHQSGLGLEAQAEAIERFAAKAGAVVLKTFVEVESGAVRDRPQLAAALALCRRTKAELVIARLDRLSRSVAFIAALLDANVEIRCADMPSASRLLLQMLAVFSEHEREMIRERTKAALAAAKARGVELGRHGRVLAAANRAEAERHAEDVGPHLLAARKSGARTFKEVCRFLEDHRVPTASGGKWHPMSVRRIELRLRSKRCPPDAEAFG